jgi:hypothetical protein
MLKSYDISILLNTGYYLNVIGIGETEDEAKAVILRVLDRPMRPDMIDETEITCREIEINYVPQPATTSLIPVPNDPKERMIFENERSGR